MEELILFEEANGSYWVIIKLMKAVIGAEALNFEAEPPNEEGFGNIISSIYTDGGEEFSTRFIRIEDVNKAITILEKAIEEQRKERRKFRNELKQ
jgi:hypothetical protein